MSRIIIKNLPENCTEDKLRKHVSERGRITDIKLLHTEDGKFRKVAFVGFFTEDEAESAKKFFNKSYMENSKLQVEKALDLGSVEKIKHPGKHSRKTDFLDEKKITKDSRKLIDKLINAPKQVRELAELETNPKFKEFLKVHKVTIDDTEEKEHSELKASKSNMQSDLDFLKKTKKMNKKTQNIVMQRIPNITNKLKLRGLPSTVNKRDILQFLRPVKPIYIKLPKLNEDKITLDNDDEDNDTGENARRFRMAFVQLKKKEDADAVLNRDGEYFLNTSNYLKITPATYRGEVTNERGGGDDDVCEEKQMQQKKNFEKWRMKEEELRELGDETDIAETGKLFVRNLYRGCSELDLTTLFSKFGPLVEVNRPIDKVTRRSPGIAFITYLIPQHAVEAYTKLDGTDFQGRVLHILPAKPRPTDHSQLSAVPKSSSSSYKRNKEEEQSKQSSSSHNWNTLFLGQNAVVDAMSERFGVEKSDILDPTGNRSAAVRVALGESQLVAETKEFLVKNNVRLDSFNQPAAARSKTTLLCKNLPADTTNKELEELFLKFGVLTSRGILLPPHGATALVEFQDSSEARNAFTNLAYRKFKSGPLYLEWAPVDVFREMSAPAEPTSTETPAQSEVKVSEAVATHKQGAEACTLFVKNLNFSSTDDSLLQFFSKCGKVESVTISKKKDMKHPGQLLSMGYGFVQFKSHASAQLALKELQYEDLDGHKLELKISHRQTKQPDNLPSSKKSKKKDEAEVSSKLLVRNIPFQCTAREIHDLFNSFGEIKTVRLPKKIMGSGKHRGFGFVDFTSKDDAKRAYESLHDSTHLYGRRLVLAWADANAESVEGLRRKAEEQLQGKDNKKRLRKNDVLDELTSARGNGTSKI